MTGVVVTKISDSSPLKNTTLAVNHIITEAQKKKIKSIDDLKNITQQVMSSNQKTILLATYNNQNQRRYLGVKLK
jgi:serine protease Do